MVKNLPAMQETWVRSLGWEDSPGGGDPPVFLPGKSPWTEKPSGLQSMSHIELDMTEQLSIVQHIYIYIYTHIHTHTYTRGFQPSPWEIMHSENLSRFMSSGSV